MLIKNGASYWKLGLQGCHKQIVELMISKGAFNTGLKAAQLCDNKEIIDYIVKKLKV